MGRINSSLWFSVKGLIKSSGQETSSVKGHVINIVDYVGPTFCHNRSLLQSSGGRSHWEHMNEWQYFEPILCPAPPTAQFIEDSARTGSGTGIEASLLSEIKIRTLLKVNGFPFPKIEIKWKTSTHLNIQFSQFILKFLGICGNCHWANFCEDKNDMSKCIVTNSVKYFQALSLPMSFHSTLRGYLLLQNNMQNDWFLATK